MVNFHVHFGCFFWIHSQYELINAFHTIATISTQSIKNVRLTFALLWFFLPFIPFFCSFSSIFWNGNLTNAWKCEVINLREKTKLHKQPNVGNKLKKIAIKNDKNKPKRISSRKWRHVFINSIFVDPFVICYLG